jgi:hypothetical protein
MRADHREMPRGHAPGGEPPHDEVLVTDSHAVLLELNRRPKARADESLRFRFSDATGCARQAGYQMSGTPETNARTDVDYWVMGIGSLLHDEVQRAILERYFADRMDFDPYVKYVDGHTHWGLMGLCEFEVPCRIEGLGSGHADIWLPRGLPGTSIEGIPTVVELKTKGGAGYKLQVGVQGQAQGPAWQAKVQGALCAEALGAELLIVATAATEAVSAGLAERKGIQVNKHRAFAEWRYTAEDWDDWLTLEKKRVHRIMELLDAGTLPPRSMSEPDIPPRARVVDPMTGAMVAERDGKTVWTGSTWRCPHYCSWRSQCIADGPS